MIEIFFGLKTSSGKVRLSWTNIRNDHFPIFFSPTSIFGQIMEFQHSGQRGEAWPLHVISQHLFIMVIKSDNHYRNNYEFFLTPDLTKWIHQTSSLPIRNLLKETQPSLRYIQKLKPFFNLFRTTVSGKRFLENVFHVFQNTFCFLGRP